MSRRKAATWDEAMQAIAADRFDLRVDESGERHVFVYGPRGGSKQYVGKLGVLLVEMASLLLVETAERLAREETER